ncbi:hypothetical protein M405DRAFT_904051 [Rhizopogon salebrosus TDB-379]|nr:hypothetical protein M405DRAFT_904051 [Rhizopogon salebrosus TDB-379]
MLLRPQPVADLHFLFVPERVLAPTEGPAAIVIRRLQQAGYDQLDSLAFLGAEGMTFLMKFVYKSQLLGPMAKELTFDEFEIIDITGCSLPTIPIVLHQNASSIVYLGLAVISSHANAELIFKKHDP